MLFWPASFHLSEHFRVTDFACHDPHATPCPTELVERAAQPLCQSVLEPIRHFVCGDRPVLIASGYRTPEWNAHEGGAEDSRHLHGDAADIWCPSLGLTAGPALYLAVLALHRAGLLPDLGGLGRYENRIHVDTRPHQAGELVTWDNCTYGARG